jgi:hypothetical protein
MSITPSDFKEAFEAAFIVNRRMLHWDKPRRRTANMIAYIYRTIANSFPEIEIEYEYSNIDAVFYRGDLNNIEVGIEHENSVSKIGTELNNFAKHHFPLNVLITYTGWRAQYIVNRQSNNMNRLCDRLMLILNPENLDPWSGKQTDPSQHNKVVWEYFVWTSNGLQEI